MGLKMTPQVLRVPELWQAGGHETTAQVLQVPEQLQANGPVKTPQVLQVLEQVAGFTQTTAYVLRVSDQWKA